MLPTPTEPDRSHLQIRIQHFTQTLADWQVGLKWREESLLCRQKYNQAHYDLD